MIAVLLVKGCQLFIDGVTQCRGEFVLSAALLILPYFLQMFDKIIVIRHCRS